MKEEEEGEKEEEEEVGGGGGGGEKEQSISSSRVTLPPLEVGGGKEEEEEEEEEEEYQRFVQIKVSKRLLPTHPPTHPTQLTHPPTHPTHPQVTISLLMILQRYRVKGVGGWVGGRKVEEWVEEVLGGKRGGWKVRLVPRDACRV